MRITYTCKFCGAIGWTDCECTDDQAKAIGLTVDLWRKMIACDRCADYIEAKRRATDKIFRFCRALTMLQDGQTSAKKSRDVLRSALEHSTKALTKTVCDHYGKTPVWNMEFVDTFMDLPEKAGQIIGQYVRSVRSGEFHSRL